MLRTDEVEKSGGAPVREGPPTTPEQALERNEGGDSGEQRPDSDQGGHEPHPRDAGPGKG